MGSLALADIASDQWGLLTAAQARRAGKSHQALVRLTASGALERLTHGVYRLTGAPSHPHDGVRAAWLALDPAVTAGERVRRLDVAVTSHRSAAQLHQLGDVDADKHEFTTPNRKQSRRVDIRLHRGQLSRDEWTLVGGLPVTTPARTIRDLAASRLDGGHLAGVVRDALVDHHVDMAVLAASLRPFAQHYGVPVGDATALIQDFLDQAGVPDATRLVVRLADPEVRAALTAMEIPSRAASGPAAASGLSDLQKHLAELMRLPAFQEQLADLVVRPEFRAYLEAAAQREHTQALAPDHDDEESSAAHG